MRYIFILEEGGKVGRKKIEDKRSKKNKFFERNTNIVEK